MSYYAKIDENNLVTQVIVADQGFINSGALGDPKLWIETDPNTHGGVHYGTDGKPDGGTALRKNYAGIGYTYDPARDAFIPPKPPFTSWRLNEDTCNWEPPVPMPQDGQRYRWDEATTSWILIQPPSEPASEPTP